MMTYFEQCPFVDGILLYSSTEVLYSVGRKCKVLPVTEIRRTRLDDSKHLWMGQSVCETQSCPESWSTEMRCSGRWSFAPSCIVRLQRQTWKDSWEQFKLHAFANVWKSNLFLLEVLVGHIHTKIYGLLLHDTRKSVCITRSCWRGAVPVIECSETVKR